MQPESKVAPLAEYKYQYVTQSREIMLLKRTELGTAELVQSVTPVPFENKVEQSEKDTTVGNSGENRVVNEGISSGSFEKQEPWVPPVDLGHLAQEEARIVQGMLVVLKI